MRAFWNFWRGVLLIGGVLLALVAPGCSRLSPQRPKGAKAEPVEKSRAITANKTNPIVDLVLIYDGWKEHPQWNVDSFRPYVSREKNGKFEWLFDGFLFIDFFAPSGDRLCPISNHQDANRQDWQELIDHYFQDNQSIAALDQLLDELERKGHTPARKRRVVITLPTPIIGSHPDDLIVSRPWGELKGEKLDFLRESDRMKAEQWYINEVLKRWHEKKFKHLELAGFYWVFERSWTVHHTHDIGQYVNSKGYFLYWIPSWPQGRPNWKDLGFDFVYQQPNYFFHRKPTPSDRLESACQFAEKCGTTMEMEFNRDLLTKPVFLTYFDEYLQAYATHHVWEKKPVAYYEGTGAWADMAHSSDSAVRRRYEAMSDIIVERQKKADAGFVFDQGAK